VIVRDHFGGDFRDPYIVQNRNILRDFIYCVYRLIRDR